MLKDIHEFSRTELLIGREGLLKLKNSKIAVFGIGGVGSFTVEALARAGVGSFVLVDNDCISITNINRQIHATRKTIGMPKVEIMKERILDINQYADVETHRIFYLPETAEGLVRKDFDYIVDAMDTVTAKIDIVIRAGEAGIPIISCMGAGNKLDPTQFEVADIYKTSVCPLCRVVRTQLRKNNIAGLKVVYSREVPIKTKSDECNTSLDNNNNNTTTTYTSNTNTNNATADTNTDTYFNNKRNIPGSISFVPSVAGLIMAGEVVRDILSTN